MADPSIAQSASDGLGDGFRDTVVVTLGAPPTPGNLMVGFISTGDFPEPGTVTPPTGWTLVDAINQDFVGLHTFQRAVQMGDGTSYTWTMSVTDDHHGAIYECANVATAVSAFGSASDSSSLTLSPAATPLVTGCLALSAYTNDSGGITGIISAGWTIDFNEDAGHPCDTAHKTALTSGLSAVPVTWTQNFGNACAAYVVLLAPGGAPPPDPSAEFVFLNVPTCGWPTTIAVTHLNTPSCS